MQTIGTDTRDLAAAASALIQKTRWKHQASGHWKFHTPAYLGTLTPVGVTKNGQSRIKAYVALRRSPSYAIACDTFEGVNKAKAWVERTIEAIASAGTAPVTERVEFEVADYISAHPSTDALEAKLRRRMASEARRLGLTDARIVSQSDCTRHSTRSRVWHCDGLRTISAGGVP